ncbi:hypothetical protein AVEN_142351-1 [Araneus ventricosus]|uniref:SOCS box domain-containing protein n=1 Tax=Araneus ventricosus TaxID=182803 RepID=A0A4Y2T0K5_ARAVE|nr:hypothetical protein AVEN_80082-1 [Araneus ventricosus]GBN94115.1 hypothetical protein AVEN_142351-1 [Araneus ventricosus]
MALREPDFPRRSQHIDVELMDAESIVKCCFVVQKSVTYLDLSVSYHSTLIKKKGLERCLTEIFAPVPGVLSTFFICTKEQLRRILAPDRKILYLYHLDLPNGRERTLRQGRPENLSLISCSKVYSLRPFPCLYKRNFYRYIQEVVHHSKQKVALIMRLLKPIKSVVFINEYYVLIHYFLEILYSRCTDSNIFVNFMSQIDFREWLLYHTGRRYILESILFHCHKCKYDLLEQMPFCCDPINISMLAGRFDNVAVLLRYRDAPRFAMFPCKDTLEKLSRRPRNPRTREELLQPAFEGLLSSRRLLLLLQIICSFFEGPCIRNMRGVTHATRSEALRLVWRSIPDPYITFDEMTRVCGRRYRITNLRNAHYTYRKAVVFDSSFIQPRTLRQYCRTTIRKSLSDNHKLPEGVDRLGLPTDMKLFLNLLL